MRPRCCAARTSFQLSICMPAGTHAIEFVTSVYDVSRCVWEPYLLAHWEAQDGAAKGSHAVRNDCCHHSCMWHLGTPHSKLVDRRPGLRSTVIAERERHYSGILPSAESTWTMYCWDQSNELDVGPYWCMQEGDVVPQRP